MDYQPAELAARLQAEGEAVQAFFTELLPDQWNLEVYTDKTLWRTRDLLAHFVAAEQGFQQIIQSVAAGGASVGADFDLDAYNDRTVGELRQLDRVLLLSQYTMVRERTGALVRAMSLAQLQLKGQHPSLGVVPIVEMVRLIYHHNNLHLRDLRRALKLSRMRHAAPHGAAG